MTNQKAITGIKEILKHFEDEELYGLSATITHGLLKDKINTKEDALDVILKYSPDIVSILKRKAVTRDILFSYLYDNNIIVILPTTKDKLINKICTYWDLEYNTDKEKTLETTEKKVEENAVVLDKTEGNSVQVMARQFSEWFYKIMNQDTCIESEHFYPDATIKINLISNHDCTTETAENPECITQLLFKIKSENNLYFNPNLTHEGVQGKIDPHGLVIILSCGTLHSNDICVGVFEQVFALARDPFCENNWKVKSTELNLRSKNEINKTPCLLDSDLTLVELYGT